MSFHRQYFPQVQFRKKSFTQRRGDAKKRRKKKSFLSRLNRQYEFQIIADDAEISLRRRVFARVFFSVNSGSL